MKLINFKLFSILAFIFILSSCANGDDDLCIDSKVRFTNTTSDLYEIILEGKVEAELPSGRFIEIEKNPGRYEYKTTQLDGFLLFPTVDEGTITIEACEEIEVFIK